MRIAPYDYAVTEDSLEIRMLGHCLWRLAKKDIVSARVQSMTAILDGAKHPFSTLRLGNRFQRYYVLIERRNWPQFIAITPLDPEQCVKELLELSSLPES